MVAVSCVKLVSCAGFAQFAIEHILADKINYNNLGYKVDVARVNSTIVRPNCS